MPSSLIAGRYELQGQLGEGGMGVVWRALDIKTGGSVAIKLMKDMSDPVAVDLFTKEWRALAEISHPNIVEVRDVDVIEENGQKKPFFVMPLLRGTTLADLIADASARLTVERVVEIATHVCRGLQAAHQRGLIHRDLKPTNILVMEDDSAKIIDFGVVHLAGSKSVTGQKGTFQYMSPEQALMREITPASDLFSMGIILYEALTRRKPFARNTVQDTMEGGKLTRRLVVGQDTSNQKEAKIDAQSAGQKDSLSVHIRVDGGQVRITNDKGAVLDEFTAPGQNFSNGRIAIKSDSLFVVRSGI